MNLEDRDIARITDGLTPKSVKFVAVVYMELKQAQVDQLQEQHADDPDQFKRSVIIMWRNKSTDNNKPKLANYLQNSTVLKAEEISGILGPYKFKPIPPPEPSNEPTLTHSELGRLAEVITLPDMKYIAVHYMPFTDTDLSIIEADNKKQSWGTVFDILVKWDKKAGGRQELIEILKKSGKVTPKLILRILGDGGTPEKSADTGTDAKVVSFSGTSSEAGPSSQVLDPNGTLAGEGHKQTASVKPYTDSGRKINQADLAETLTKMGQKGQLPSATVSSAFSFRPLNDLSMAKSYDWLKFNEIQEVTKDMVKTKSPVVVAVLDTGIYEDHPDLKHHILADQSHCFVPGDDLSTVDDLRKDRGNHGTMVAGIIKLNGPENVRIVNLKVLPEPGKDADIGTMIDALRYVKKLRIEDDDGVHRVHIVNMSVGQPLLHEDLDSALLELAGEMVLIASAGNYGATSSNAVTYPGKHPNVICVGSCDKYGCETNVSSKGKEVDFLCPGHEVFSTVTKNDEGFLYGVDSGSSFAAPHAAAAAAHVLVAIEAEKGLEYRKRLCNSLMMKCVLKRMCSGDKVLRPYEECFRRLPFLYGFCGDALEGR